MSMIQLACIAILLVTFCSHTLSVPAINPNPSYCCFAYASNHIPRNRVTGYFQTSSKCSLKAVILVTRRGKQICVDPQQTWVQTYINDLTQTNIQG
ncbi:C-C motif chemokine 4-like isoform X2 [Protopterus annectens]|uniref:C-C motif chemokine 4-like isoform X2 n=1 Tax=Protopterus annectens TaxID=7888 RepID=UPI001CFA1533|nr:C-C motif chemokine 4-like isoform X2 [Protopterus annectens]